MKSTVSKANPHESTVLTYSTAESIAARRAIFSMMNEYQASAEEKERSLGLFLRGSLLARILAIHDLYKQIVEIPGSILDIGTWRGQTAVLCENFRAIHEPLNLTRRIICFDSFEGYKGFSDKDVPTEIHRDGTYNVGGGEYGEFLAKLLIEHEKSNAMGHNHGKHRVIAGDCRQTIPDFFTANPNEYVSLAFFDLNAYEPTLVGFDEVWARLVPGGIAAFWQLTRANTPAEGRVYAEHILPRFPHRIGRTETYPGLCYLVKT